jgi:hypothetical protein
MDHRYTPGYWASTGRWIYLLDTETLPPRKRVGAIISAIGGGCVLAAPALPHSWWIAGGGVLGLLAGAWIVWTAPR